MEKILVIQTAFIGDVVLATGILEKLHQFYPEAKLDFMVRKGNEGLLMNHPFINEVLVWNKKKHKISNLLNLTEYVHEKKYDLVVNVQRFFATGMLTAFSGAKQRIGFSKNPWSLFFTKRIKHRIGNRQHPVHEIERNNDLIASLTDDTVVGPKLYPSRSDMNVAGFYERTPYVTISPASVWFTKQYPATLWAKMIARIPPELDVYLLGGEPDHALCDGIVKESGRKDVYSLAGKLTMLQSAAVMKGARMNYVNDSAPLHFASAVDAPVVAVYCSTIPEFGFGPTGSRSVIEQTPEPLPCRPCGLHGRKACPLGHFKCAYNITEEQLLRHLPA